MTRTWDARLYDRHHSFVWERATEVFAWLDPQPGETIVDLGCGTGHLSARIAAARATVIGIDSSPEMLAAARNSYPDLDLRPGDARTFELDRPVDAVFSNATLHWVPEAELVARRVFAALRPGGRFVAEFGGRGNVTGIMSAVRSVLEPRGLYSWRDQYYPTAEEYGLVLDEAGLEVKRVELVTRPTPLEEGLRTWLRMFRGEMLELIPPDELEASLTAIEESARADLFRDGVWWADYVRLRVKAVRPS
jgi:SAM-dependent methyltransferase